MKKTVNFLGRSYQVDENVKFITQDSAGLVVAHFDRPVEQESDYGSSYWRSEGSVELGFPGSVIEAV